MATRRWFHPNLGGKEAEEMLLDEGQDGSFLVRPSQNNPGDFTLSVRRGQEITHIRIQTGGGDYYDLYGGEKFATLGELVLFYTENPGQLKEKSGTVIELKQPLFCEEVATERWYHGALTGRDAELLLTGKGQDGSYLVRTSVHSPGNFVLSTRVGDEISHVIIRRKDKLFDMGGGPQFRSLLDLVEHYKKNPLVETNGRVITLKHPFHSTSFLPSNIAKRISELEKQNQDMYGKAGFWEEFEQMQQQECRSYNRKVGVQPTNRSKNRFKNILPFDHTRVVLTEGSDETVPGSDYINANYINGEVGEESQFRYIATQGCLPSTIVDFWRMVWQEDARVIVMITNEVERGRNKCARYWPNPEEPTEQGALRLVNAGETFNPNYILRHFLVTHSEKQETRDIYQFHFKAWPDHGVPQDPGVVLGFLDDVNHKYREVQRESDKHRPMVVHCSAGIGRTGTFIVIDIILASITANGWKHEIDIQQTVQIARLQRSGMVQTEQQYKFVYRAIQHYVEACEQKMTHQAGAMADQSNYDNFDFHTKPNASNSSSKAASDPLYDNMPLPKAKVNGSSAPPPARPPKP